MIRMIMNFVYKALLLPCERLRYLEDRCSIKCRTTSASPVTGHLAAGTPPATCVINHGPKDASFAAWSLGLGGVWPAFLAACGPEVARRPPGIRPCVPPTPAPATGGHHSTPAQWLYGCSPIQTNWKLWLPCPTSWLLREGRCRAIKFIVYLITNKRKYAVDQTRRVEPSFPELLKVQEAAEEEDGVPLSMVRGWSMFLPRGSHVLRSEAGTLEAVHPVYSF